MTFANATRLDSVAGSSAVRVRVFDVAETDSIADFALLNEAERARADRFQRSSDRNSYVAVRAAFRRELAEELNMAPAVVPLEPGLHNRPQVPAELAGDLDFNVSHSSRGAAIAVARGCRVGIDLESVRIVRDVELLIQEVMGCRERARLSQLSGSEWLHAFYECWTRKEAILKAVGVGIGYPVRELDIPILPVDGRVVIEGSDTELSAAGVWSVRTAHMSEEFVLSVAFNQRS